MSGRIGKWTGPSGGGAGGNATPADLLEGMIAIVDGDEIIGIIPDIGDYNITPGASDIIIPYGRHSGKGVVKGVKIASGTAVAANVLTGKTFSNSSGVNLSGSMANRGSLSITPSSSSQSFQAGYYSAVNCAAVPSTYVRSAQGTPTVWSMNECTITANVGWRPTHVFFIGNFTRSSTKYYLYPSGTSGTGFTVRDEDGYLFTGPQMSITSTGAIITLYPGSSVGSISNYSFYYFLFG